jgi:hypothetical protein
MKRCGRNGLLREEKRHDVELDYGAIISGKVVGMSHGKPQIGNSAGIIETGNCLWPGTVVLLSFGTKIGCMHIRRELKNDAKQE